MNKYLLFSRQQRPVHLEEMTASDGGLYGALYPIKSLPSPNPDLLRLHLLKSPGIPQLGAGNCIWGHIIRGGKVLWEFGHCFWLPVTMTTKMVAWLLGWIQKALVLFLMRAGAGGEGREIISCSSCTQVAGLAIFSTRLLRQWDIYALAILSSQSDHRDLRAQLENSL